MIDKFLKDKPGRSIIQTAKAFKAPHAYLPSVKFTKATKTRDNRIIQDRMAFVYVFRRSLLSLFLSILYHFNVLLKFYDVVVNDMKIYKDVRAEIIEIF